MHNPGLHKIPGSVFNNYYANIKVFIYTEIHWSDIFSDFNSN